MDEMPNFYFLRKGLRGEASEGGTFLPRRICSGDVGLIVREGLNNQ